MSAHAVEQASHHQALQREHLQFALFRTFEAALLALLIFSPAGSLVGPIDEPRLAMAVCVAYLVLSTVLLWAVRKAGSFRAMRLQVLFAVTLDIAVAALASHAMVSASAGIAMMLLFNVGAAALFLPLPASLTVAVAAAAALGGGYAWRVAERAQPPGTIAELLMFAIGFLAIASLIHYLGRQMRASIALADLRGAEAANLAEINDLVIRRMRTGVLVVDCFGRISLANEAALELLTEHARPDQHPQRLQARTLSQLAPSLALRLAEWLQNGQSNDTPLVFGDEQIEVMPRFTRLMANSDTVLVFLDDSSLVSRRAELLTLGAMGRFAGSLAHEIRNPLAAINYATQLLEESPDIVEGDRRLLQIIHQQAMRTNGIIESVLGLARREPAKPELLDLVKVVNQFITDYRMVIAEDNAHVQAMGIRTHLPAMFDARHLNQVLTALVNNCVRHGHLPGEIPRIEIHLELNGARPAMRVRDHGPGIAEGIVGQLYRPFFTTAENGTGLGLYLSNELCRANDASLEFIPPADGGASFRVTFQTYHPGRATSRA